jgi:hypothetical protein
MVLTAVRIAMIKFDCHEAMLLSVVVVKAVLDSEASVSGYTEELHALLTCSSGASSSRRAPFYRSGDE